MDEPAQPNEWDTPQWRATNILVSRLLPERFPELRDEYEREVVAYDGEDDAPMLNYSQIFGPFLERALSEEPDDSELLGRIYAFLKELESNPDPQFSQVATVEIAEFLESRPKLLRRARPHLGPEMHATTRVRPSWYWRFLRLIHGRRHLPPERPTKPSS